MRCAAGRIKLGRRPAVAYLMIASYEVHSLWVLNLERQQQADGFQGVCAAVDVVSQEQIVNVGYVPGRGRRPILLKQPHQVPKLTMQVPKDLHRRCSIPTGGDFSPFCRRPPAI